MHHPLFGTSGQTLVDEEMFRVVLQSLDRVGKDKAVGYLPLSTVRVVLGLQLEDLLMFYGAHLQTLIVHEAESCIKSGAVFVYSASAIENSHVWKGLQSQGFASPAEFIAFLGRNWVSDGHLLKPLIRTLFGD